MKETVRKIFALLPDGDIPKLGILFVMMLVASFLALLGVGTVPVFVLAVIDADRILQLPIVGDFLAALNITTPARLVGFGASILLLIYALKNAYMFFYDYINTRFMLRRVLFLQNRLFKAYMKSPYLLYLTRNSSELIRNISGEATRVLDGALKPVLVIALHAIMSVVIISALIYAEPFIAGLGILMFGGFSLLFLRLTRKKMTWFGEQALYHRNWMTKAMLEGLGGFKDAKVLKRESYFLDTFNKHANKILKYELWRSILRALPVQIIEMLALGGVLFIAVTMILQGRDVEIIVPTIALFGAAVMKLKPSIFTIIEQINSIRFNLNAIDAIHNDLLKLEALYSEQPKGDHTFKKETGRHLLTINDAIDVQNLTFTYPDTDEPAVRNINMTIPKNHAVAFVGMSGAGKTTLADVILGLLEPQEGGIFADGTDIHEDIDAWQQNIGYIPQTIYLLDDSIRRNICFGMSDSEIDEEKLQTAIQTAQLTELISGLKKGDQTLVGERGIRLSGGQRQRIGIARALYHNPQLLIMDEATSALDNLTEKFVIDAIEQLKGEKTIIMIAHRLTTVQNCDTIYLMQGAEIIASGSYNKLLQTSRAFREMSMTEDVEEPATIGEA